MTSAFPQERQITTLPRNDAKGHSRRRQPRALFDPLPQCAESGLRVGAFMASPGA